MRRFASISIACLLGLASVPAPALADEPAPPESPAILRPGATDNPAPVPSCLHGLTLTAEQQAKIHACVRDYEADLATVWQQFGDRYMESVRTEALLLTAIEDNLTEPQRLQVREQRRRTARHEAVIAGAGTKPNKATGSPASAVEEGLSVAGVSLTIEQEAAADELQGVYLGRLRSLNRDLEGLHTRLISLEADKLVKLEEILTKEQLEQLRETRQQTPVTATAAAERNDIRRSN